METRQVSELEAISTEGPGGPDSLVAPGSDIPDEIINDLLGIAADPEKGQSDEGDEPAGTSDEATFNALAKQHGLDPEALYKATVKLPDELGTASVEQLKDEAAAYRKGEAQRTAFADERTTFANQKLQAMQELQALIGAIPESQRSQQLIEQATAFQKRYIEQQDGLLLQVIPTWADPAVKTRDRQMMASLLTKSYGVPDALLDLPLPAGLKKMIFDYAELRQRMEGIKSRQSARTSKATKSTKPQSTAQQDRFNGLKSSVDSGKQSKIDAIAQLLQG